MATSISVAFVHDGMRCMHVGFCLTTVEKWFRATIQTRVEVLVRYYSMIFEEALRRTREYFGLDRNWIQILQNSK
jgi:hypothetical protein